MDTIRIGLLLSKLGFPTVVGHVLLDRLQPRFRFGFQSATHDFITVRASRRFAYDETPKRLVFECDYRRGNRGRRHVSAVLSVALDDPKLEQKFDKWLQYEAIPKHAAYEACRLESEKQRKNYNYAVAEYERQFKNLTGVQWPAIIKGTTGPVGVKMSFDLLGTPEEVARKMEAIQSIQKIN